MRAARCDTLSRARYLNSEQMSEYYPTIATVVSILSLLIAGLAWWTSQQAFNATQREDLMITIRHEGSDSVEIWRRAGDYGISVPHICQIINNSDRSVILTEIQADPESHFKHTNSMKFAWVPPDLKANYPQLPLELKPSEIISFPHIQEFSISDSIGKLFIPLDGREMRDYETRRSLDQQEYSNRLYKKGIDFFGNVGEAQQTIPVLYTSRGPEFKSSQLVNNPSFTLTFRTSRGTIQRARRRYYEVL